MKSLFEFALKAMFVICVLMFILGFLVNLLLPEESAPREVGGTSFNSAAVPQNAVDPRFNGPGHPMYGKNYYQIYNEIVFELHQKGYPEEQVRLACMTLEAMKCGFCDGYGSRGHYRCETCKGDGVLEN
jgi:hypothetical protein